MDQDLALSRADVLESERPGRDEELAWIDAARAGDATAFRRIVERHHRSLFVMAARLVGDAVEAQDLVQESFAKAYVHLDRFDASFRLSTWLHRITLNTCRDYLKSARRRERATPMETFEERSDAGPSPEESLAARQSSDRVQRALDQLKPSYREILVLKDMQGLSYQEIKDITGSAITSLKIRAVRARAKLRDLLEVDR
jgi:RNA polymerase sigma-70 factor (ECF subfamily)